MNKSSSHGPEAKTCSKPQAVTPEILEARDASRTSSPKQPLSKQASNAPKVILSGGKLRRAISSKSSRDKCHCLVCKALGFWLWGAVGQGHVGLELKTIQRYMTIFIYPPSLNTTDSRNPKPGNPKPQDPTRRAPNLRNDQNPKQQ